MPISMPAKYEFYTKKKKKHNFVKTKKVKAKPYGWHNLTIKDVEQNLQSIMLKYNTRKNNKRTWDKLKKEINSYIKYIWNKDHRDCPSINDFAVVKCSYPETMNADQLISNQLIIGVLISLPNKEEPMYISILQQQYPT